MTKSRNLMLTCPRTGLTIATTIKVDAGDLVKSWHSSVSVDCPHCHHEHEFSIRDAFMDMILQHPSNVVTQRAAE